MTQTSQPTYTPVPSPAPAPWAAPAPAPVAPANAAPYADQVQPYLQPSGPQSTQPVARRTSVGFRSPAAVLGAVGAASIAVSFTVLDWFRSSKDSFTSGASKTTFSELHDNLEKVQAQTNGTKFGKLLDAGMAPAYFSWLGWALFGVAVIAAAIATSKAGTVLTRSIGVAAAVTGLVVTAINLQLFTVDKRLSDINEDIPTDYLWWVKHTSFGAWAAGLGFVLLAVASAIGPRKR